MSDAWIREAFHNKWHLYRDVRGFPDDLGWLRALCNDRWIQKVPPVVDTATVYVGTPPLSEQCGHCRKALEGGGQGGGGE